MSREPNPYGTGPRLHAVRLACPACGATHDMTYYEGEPPTLGLLCGCGNDTWNVEDR